MACMQDNLWFETPGLWSKLRVSHNTILFFPRLKGSRNIATGRRYTSLLQPSAWYVLEPSKFHIGSSSWLDGSESTVFVLHRMDSPVPSIQTYKTWTRSPWSRLMYLSRSGLLSVAVIFKEYLGLVKLSTWKKRQKVIQVYSGNCFVARDRLRSPETSR